MPNIKVSTNDDNKKTFDKVRNDISQEITSLQGLNKVEKRGKNDDIMSMIKHYIDMTDKVEDRRNGIHSFTLQILSIWVAAIFVLFTLYLGKDVTINSILFWTIFAVIVEQLTFSFYAVFVFEKQSSFKYPFLKKELEQYGNKWKWFYYGSKPIQKISTKVVKESRDFNKTIQPFLESYKEFIHNYVTENLDSEIVDNIQQLHLLRVHNYYKNKFYLQLTNIQKWAIYMIPIVAALGALISWRLT